MAKYNPQGKNVFLDVLVYSLLIIGMLIIIFPILYVVMTSFAPEKEYLTRGFFILPHHFTLEGYTYLLQNSSFLKAFKNAVEITVIGMIGLTPGKVGALQAAVASSQCILPAMATGQSH